MSESAVDNTALELLGERSREKLHERLAKATTTLGSDAFLELIVDLLIQSGLDRDHLKQRVVELIASRFGKSSEKSSEAQVAMFGEIVRAIQEEAEQDRTEAETPTEETNLPDLMAQTEAEIEDLIAQQRQTKKEERERRRQAEKEARAQEKPQIWPTHLPIREDIREIPEVFRCCDDCGEERQVLRYETSWRLVYTTTTEVLLTKTPVLACASHHGSPVSEPVEPKPVDGGRMDFTLAAHVLYLRYTQNLPISRIVEMLNTQGVPVSEEMVHTLVRVTAKRAKPVINALANEVRLAVLVNLDDTPVLVLKKDKKRHRHTGRIWLALGDGHWAWFFSTKTWETAEAEKILGQLTGTVQGDGYPGYPKFAERQGVDLAGCWAHMRRKLYKSVKAKDPRATLPMALIQGMYRVERLGALRQLSPKELVVLRQERSAPLMRALRKWAEEVASSIVTDSPLGKAWTYLNGQWSRLQVFLEDGTVGMDNNAAERGLRRITIGRKLWLFFQNDKNVEWAAVLASLMATARLHGANELEYMTWLLRELARREWSDEAARQLLPDVWLASQEEAKESASV